MRRRALIVLLTLGTIGGYASGFAHLGRGCHARHESFERHVARVCADAARAAPAGAATAEPAAEPPPW